MIRFRTTASLLTCSLFASVPVAAQNLWSKVPAFPTTCYNNDQFFSQIDLVGQESAALATRQLQENDAIQQQLKELDGATQQSRLMAFMQKDPMNAGKFMQDVATAGQRAGEMQEDIDAKWKALKDQYAPLESQYKADLAKTDPLWMRFQNAQAPGAEVPPAKIKEYAAAFNAAYENQVCAKWWKASSPFVAYLADVKRFELESRVPLGEFGARTKRQNLDIMGIPSAGYKSTAEAEGVLEYVKEAQKISQLRFLGPASYR